MNRDPVPVSERFRTWRDGPNLIRGKLRDSPECLLDLSLFDGELMGVGDVLIIAAATLLKVRTGGRDPVR